MHSEDQWRSGWMRVLSRMDFPFQLKCKMVEINVDMMSRVTVRERLSKRAVMKEKGLGWVCLQQRRWTTKET